MRFSCIANTVAKKVYGSGVKCTFDTQLCEEFLHIGINALIGNKACFLEFRIHDRYVDIVTIKNTDLSKVLDVVDSYSKLKMVRFKESVIHTEYKETLGLKKIHDYRYAVVPKTWSVDKARYEYDLCDL